jgi:phosphohistidine swiveling domain-containing protein
MICDLANIAVENTYQNSLLSDLAGLAQGGVSVIPTVVLPVVSFEHWQHLGNPCDSDVDDILDWAKSIAVASPFRLLMRISTERKYQGLLDKVSVERNFAEIRSAIDRVYRSWGDERARASRIVCRVDEEKSKPSLIVQPVAKKVYSVLTRQSITGGLTTVDNYEQNVNNRLPAFSIDVDRLVRACDALIRRPVKISFACDDNFSRLTVVSISDENMTTDARWRALGDLLERKLIDDAQFLMAITPDMIGFARGLEFDPASASIHIQGLPASRGLAIGKLIFRGAKINNQAGQDIVFLADDSYPEDIYILEKSCAAIGLFGGMTSHLAVVCRGLHIPAVTGCGGRVNLKKRVFQLIDGRTVKEHTRTLVDGTTGSAGFSDADVRPHWVRGDQCDEVAEHILRCCDRLSGTRFKELPIEIQWHIAELKNRMRSMGLLR